MSEYLVKCYSTERGGFEERWDERPPLGGYKSTQKYGSPSFCPTATRWHRRAREKTGTMPNLVWFGSVEAAVVVGYSPCGNCWIHGDEAMERWEAYESACDELGVEPIPPFAVIERLRENEV